jgi:rhodanese-related sulfurtransferase
MGLFSFLKDLFSGETSMVSEAGNKFDNLPGNLFKQEYKASDNAVLLDVRTKGEVASGTLPGAKNIDFMSADFATKVGALDKSKTYFVFCRSGNRSGQACKAMFKMGYDVRNLMGGIGAYPG